jgi:hypothetical protein
MTERTFDDRSYELAVFASASVESIEKHECDPQIITSVTANFLRYFLNATEAQAKTLAKIPQDGRIISDFRHYFYKDNNYGNKVSCVVAYLHAVDEAFNKAGKEK